MPYQIITVKYPATTIVGINVPENASEEQIFARFTDDVLSQVMNHEGTGYRWDAQDFDDHIHKELKAALADGTARVIDRRNEIT